MIGSAFYTNKQPADERKLRGGYYTPLQLAGYLAKWGIAPQTRRILEPCCGDGNFIVASLEYLSGVEGCNHLTHEITAIELDSGEMKKARARAEQLPASGTSIEWIEGDFFETYGKLAAGDRFDLVIGNPPFIRFQYFGDDSRDLAFAHLRGAGYRPNKLANSWAAFVELSIELLRQGGCLAMVVPAELLQVSYAEQLRHRLAHQFEQILLVGFKKLVFPEIQQEVFLLLASGKRDTFGDPSDIHTLEIRDGEELVRLSNLSDATAHMPAKHSRNGMKWTSLFIDQSAFSALDEAQKTEKLVRLGDLAQVDVGIVTGRNSFFILNQDLRKELQASALTSPIVGKTSAFKSITFNRSDFNSYKKEFPCFLLDLNGVVLDTLPQPLRKYLEAGESEGIDQAYKCRIRKRWFDVPSIYSPDAFLFRQIHRYPLLAVNQAAATSTDTIHRVRVKSGHDPQKLAAVFFNSLTLAWAEVCGRSYGGGVLELEPREAEEIPVPYSSQIDIDAEKVETLLRSDRPYEVLDYVDEVALKNYAGFDSLMVQWIRKAWEQLRDRRNQRHHRQGASPSQAVMIADAARTRRHRQSSATFTRRADYL